MATRPSPLFSLITFASLPPFLQENAIPLAIYMLGQSYTQPGAAEDDPLDAAKPALCALLQRLAARDRGVRGGTPDGLRQLAQCGLLPCLLSTLRFAAPSASCWPCCNQRKPIFLLPLQLCHLSFSIRMPLISDAAASIAQCGGVPALVSQMTANHPARRAAGCFALYFLGWQGTAIRWATAQQQSMVCVSCRGWTPLLFFLALAGPSSMGRPQPPHCKYAVQGATVSRLACCRSAIYEALAQLAVACRLPHRALMAFWRFWEQQQQQPAAAGQAGSRPGSPLCASQAGGGSHADLAEGREAQWEPLALLLHMLAEGSVSGNGPASAASQHMLQQLDAAGTAIPAVLAHGAVASGDPAVNFAAARATHLLAQLPQNLPLLVPAVLQAGQAAAAGAADAALGESAAIAHPGYAVIGGSETAGGKAAGNAALLLWELSYSPASGGTYPPAVQLVQQGGHWLLPALEAALDPAQGRQAACRRVAAGLLACLLFEAPHQQPGTPAAAAADGMRRLLAQPAAAQVLQRLLALLQPDVAAAHPQAARAAALAVANMAAYRGAVPATAAQIPEATPAGMRAKLAGLTNRLKRATPGSLGSGDYSQALGSAGSTTEGSASSFDREQPSEPRAALQYFGAVHLLLRLVAQCSAAAAAAEATAASAARAPAAPVLAQPMSLASPTAAQQAAAAASAAAESAAEQRAVLVAVLQALNNLCVDPAIAGRLQRWARPTVEAHQQLTAALMAAMADPSLPPASREHARLLLHTESGAPGQRHALACTLLAPPSRSAAYPNP